MPWTPGDAEFDEDDVYDALGDSDCRKIIDVLDGRMSAQEISEECDIALSTTYRKLDLLSESTLLEESVDLREDGKHTSVYAVDFERVLVEYDGALDVEIGRRMTREERLASMWDEVRRGARDT
ncbi:MAG: ArsR/SmtB family transcription factor [Halobacteriota archaeon]